MTQSSESEELFAPKTQSRIDQLLSLGYIDTEVEFAGETFGLRTLNGEEELIASLVAKPYLESFGQLKSWAWANVGLALTHHNGDADFCPPVGPDLQAFGHARFRWVTKKWYWPLGELLFAEFRALEDERDALIEEIKGKSQRRAQDSFGSRDSLNVPADSVMPPEIMGLVQD